MKWLNVRGRSDCTFQFFIGGRGIGKTYSALLGHYKELKADTAGKLLYMRLTGAELDESATIDGNPYKRINKDQESRIQFERATPRIFRMLEKAEKPQEGEQEKPDFIVGYAAALSTMGNLRGVDFSDVTEIYIDEFIPTDKAIKTAAIKKAGELFAHAYETINRNRELLGELPVKCIFTANAFSLDSSILLYFDLVGTIQHMMKARQKRYTDRERSIYIELCDAPEVVAAKKQTALYKALAGNSKFMSIAIDNRFTDYALTLTKKAAIIEYIPIMCYEDITIYRHKSNGTMYAAARPDSPPNVARYGEKERGIFIEVFYTDYKMAVQERLIYFDSAATKYRLDEILDKNVKL